VTVRTHCRQAVALLGFVTMAACEWPAPGPKILNVGFKAQERAYYCGPAVVQMFAQYKQHPMTVSQDTIWNWMVDNAITPEEALPYWPGGGASTRVQTQALSAFANISTSHDLYSGYNGLRQAIADQQKGIERNDPTIVAVENGKHVVLVIGTNWSRLNDALQSPRSHTMTLHDPAQGANLASAVGDWLNYAVDTHYVGGECVAGKPCAINVARYGQKFSAQQALSDFDAAGGSYDGPPPQNPTGRYKLNGNGQCYWEPNDSGPNQCSPNSGRYKLDGSGDCYWDANDSGPDQCSPGGAWSRPRALWRFALSALRPAVPSSRGSATFSDGNAAPAEPAGSLGRSYGAAAGVALTQAGSTDEAPPFPYAIAAAEILENARHALRKAKVDESLQMPELRMETNDLRARRILDVKSLGARPDFYVLELETRNGARVANVVITRAGHLMGVEDARRKNLTVAADITVATGIAARGGVATRSARYVYAPNDAEPGMSYFRPLVEVDTPDGKVYVNSRGRVFADPDSTVGRQRGMSPARQIKRDPGRSLTLVPLRDQP
jgi:hypothetical protein